MNLQALVVVLVALLLGLGVGGALALWLSRQRVALAVQQASGQHALALQAAQQHGQFQTTEAERLRAELARHTQAQAGQEALINRLRVAGAQMEQQATRVPELEARLAQTQAELRQHAEALAQTRTALAAERQQAQEKLALLHEARAQLATQFENLANRILEEKGERFARQHQDSLGQMLAPLQQRLREFQEQVASTYDRDSKERLSLQHELQRLAALNSRMSEDALNLTKALKGSHKAQGIWGEMVLERVLESSGLEKGREYSVQESFGSAGGNTQRPDVVIYLPEGKRLVVDAKMSLLAYERHCSATTEPERQAALREHLASVRAHIKGLSEKNYQHLLGGQTLDFVLMFIPVEPAFMLAATADGSLFTDAFAKNVLLVSPSTLLATLRTIANLWRQEHQNRNAQAIAEQCARLYDKFVGFVADVEEVGQRLEQTQRAYQAAHNKLSSGRGNLIGQADKVRKLGVKPSKALPGHLLPDPDVAGWDDASPAEKQAEGLVEK